MSNWKRSSTPRSLSFPAQWRAEHTPALLLASLTYVVCRCEIPKPCRERVTRSCLSFGRITGASRRALLKTQILAVKGVQKLKTRYGSICEGSWSLRYRKSLYELHPHTIMLFSVSMAKTTHVYKDTQIQFHMCGRQLARYTRAEFNNRGQTRT